MEVPVSDPAGDGEGLFGVWRLVSAQARMEDTGEVSDLMGGDPRGFAIIDPGGRMMTVATPSGRPLPTDDAETAAMFRGMAAYTGRFAIEEDRLVMLADVAWHPGWEWTDQSRWFEVEGDRLTLTSDRWEHPRHPGRVARAVLTWTRER
jgi:Lipocalin-like domain